MDFLKLCLLLSVMLLADRVESSEQLSHRERYRRVFSPDSSVMLGSPSRPGHLPPSEAILPGHTLLRPSLGMLKSAIKFPHRELEDGSGVYGHIDNIGIRYDGKNERVMYSKFRRTPTRRSSVYLVNFSDEELQAEPKTISEYIDMFKRQEEKNEPIDSKYNNYDLGLIRQGSSSEIDAEIPKSKQFWATQDSFNHIKVSPDAPEYNELIPSEALDDLRHWWFYHQNDFKNFAE